MTVSTERDIGIMLAKLYGVFQDIKPNHHTIRMYTEALAGFEPDVLDAARAEWIKTGKRFPLPADLIEIIERKPN